MRLRDRLRDHLIHVRHNQARCHDTHTRTRTRSLRGGRHYMSFLGFKLSGGGLQSDLRLPFPQHSTIKQICAGHLKCNVIINDIIEIRHRRSEKGARDVTLIISMLCFGSKLPVNPREAFDFDLMWFHLVFLVNV